MDKILDMICAEYGNRIITEIEPKEKNKIESFITKALGVLQEDGLYAFAIYTKSKKGDEGVEKKTAKILFNKSYELLKDSKIALLTNCDDFLKGIRTDLSNNLNHLLFAKELLERTLVYARYHAKALEKSEEKDSTEKAVD